jgi:hypothetical protein
MSGRLAPRGLRQVAGWTIGIVGELCKLGRTVDATQALIARTGWYLPQAGADGERTGPAPTRTRPGIN